jgi:hypothetical protein
MNYLLDIVQQTTYFMFDTESNYLTQIPALIQVLVMNLNQGLYSVLLIEMNFLPEHSSINFSQIQKMFNSIFRENTYLYTWGNLIQELTPFLVYNIFSFPIRSFIYNTQTTFPQWYDEWLFTNQTSSTMNSSNIIDDSVIINAPLNDPTLFLPPQMMNNIKLLKKQLWGLQDSIAYIFHQYLSKRNTLTKWTVGLDPRIQNRSPTISTSRRQQLIQYAVFDCLSLAQLVLFMNNSNLTSAFNCIKFSDELGEYIKINFIPAVSSFFKNISTDVPVIIDENVNHLMTVHDLNERPSSFVEVQSPLDESNQEPCTTTIISNSNVCPVPSPDELSIDHKVVNTFHVTSSKCNRRSLQAQKRRNQKSNIRHRKNRYNFEVVRSVNMDIHNVKLKLKQYNVKYININPVRSTLFIGVKNKQLQKEYDQLLPGDAFI